MIKRWSASSFVALALLWCYTGTKVDAWKPSSGHHQNLPDPPYVHPYNPQPPNPNPFPKPSHPKPPVPNKPPQPGPPYPPDHVFPPYVPVGSNYPFRNSETPWPFLPVPPSQNPPPPQKPPPGDPHNPLGSGPYIFLKPYDPLSTNPKPPSWKYLSSSQDPVDSPSEKPSDPLVYPPWYSSSHPVPYNPTVPVSSPFNPAVPNPPISKPPKEHQRIPLLYYDFQPSLQTPPLPEPPGLPGYRGPSIPSFHPKPVARAPKNPSVVPGFPSSSQQPKGQNYLNTKQKNALPRGFSDQYYSQEPQSHQHGKQITVPYQHSMTDPDLQTCDVPGVQRIRCGSPDISAAACEAISCCYDGQTCYFGKSVTVQCTKDAQFILVVARDATLPNIDITTISLMAEGPRCTQVDSNSAFSIYQFPVTACGSVVMEDAGKIIYENRMTSSYEISLGPLGAITRDSSYELLFQCRYTATSVETLIVEMLPLQNPPLSVAALGPISVQLRLGNGKCLTKGCNEEEAAYTSFYTDADYPVSKALRDNVYVEVHLMDRTDPNLVLSLRRCWTTTSASPHSMPQWDILINGCPNIDDRYAAIRVPVGPGPGVDFPSHHRRFIFRMFTFVDTSTLSPQSEHVYIHCSTSVCNTASGHSCEPVCYRRRRDVKSVAQTNEQTRIVVSAGPLVMIKP